MIRAAIISAALVRQRLSASQASIDRTSTHENVATDRRNTMRQIMAIAHVALDA